LHPDPLVRGPDPDPHQKCHGSPRGCTAVFPFREVTGADKWDFCAQNWSNSMYEHTVRYVASRILLCETSMIRNAQYLSKAPSFKITINICVG
jgi:hypothetical protein